MQIVSYTHARQNLASIMQKAADDYEPIIITRSGHDPSVIIPLDMLRSWEETAFQYSPPSHAERLKESIRKAEAREGIKSFDMEEFMAMAKKNEN